MLEATTLSVPVGRLILCCFDAVPASRGQLSFFFRNGGRCNLVYHSSWPAFQLRKTRAAPSRCPGP